MWLLCLNVVCFTSNKYRESLVWTVWRMCIAGFSECVWGIWMESRGEIRVSGWRRNRSSSSTTCPHSWPSQAGPLTGAARWGIPLPSYLSPQPARPPASHFYTTFTFTGVGWGGLGEACWDGARHSYHLSPGRVEWRAQKEVRKYCVQQVKNRCLEKKVCIGIVGGRGRGITYRPYWKFEVTVEIL